MNSSLKKNKSHADISGKSEDIQGLGLQFSPIKSDAGSSPQRNSVQGSARKIKDAAADWHNLILKWKQLRSDGMNFIQQIANIKLEKILSQDNGSPVSMTPDLEPLCESLTSVIGSMEKTVVKMESLKVMLSGVRHLEKYQSSTTDESDILFQSWNLHEFEETFTSLHGMYKNEVELKKRIGENVAHGQDRNLLMVYTSSWIHEPYIEERAELLLESMLLETGHR